MSQPIRDASTRTWQSVSCTTGRLGDGAYRVRLRGSIGLVRDKPFATSSGAVVIHSHVVYFLVPLPEPLGLPDGHLVECGAATTRQQFLQAEATGWPAPPPSHLAASVVFHRAAVPSGSSQDFGYLFDLAERVLPKPAGSGAGCLRTG
jgi:hypothetical protein